jgi:predicted nucleic acid-binding Zn ribbon protein
MTTKQTKRPIAATCALCGRSFLAKLARGKFCSNKCRQAAYNARKRQRKGGALGAN